MREKKNPGAVCAARGAENSPEWSARNNRESAGTQAPKLDPVEVFRARCEARALLFATGELDLHDAVDELHEAAVASGLVRDVGQDAVQAAIVDAFRDVSSGYFDQPGEYLNLKEPEKPEPLQWLDMSTWENEPRP